MSTGIVVPNLNQGRFLAAALDSLLSVTEATLSVAVVDGGSTDDSGRVIERYRDRLTYVRSHPDGGQAGSVNEGVAALTAAVPGVRYIGFLNADDLIVGDGLAVLTRALDDHADWVAVAGRAHIISESGVVIGQYPSAPFSRARFSTECTICQPASLVRRDAWEAVGGLDASFHMCFDYDLWWRLAALGPIGSVDAVVAASRDHAATKTRAHRARYFCEAMRIVRRELGRVPWHWYISEALERQAGWELGARPRPATRLLAGARALGAYAADGWRGRFTR